MMTVVDKIINRKYAKHDLETWEDICLRVASHVASVEDDHTEWTAKYFQMINEKAFLPGGRVLANAGTGIANLMNCFVLPVEDSRAGIYKTLKHSAEIFAWGGGVGYSFSNLRENGSTIKTTGGQASGPVSFMTLFDSTGDIIQQASRRGAQMGILSISHPDIISFIESKTKLFGKNKKFFDKFVNIFGAKPLPKQLKELGYAPDEKEKLVETVEKVLVDSQFNHFNISVSITDAFMEAVLKDEDWDLISPKTQKVVKTIKAKELFRKLAESAWSSGDPGVFFFDRTNEDNMVKYLGDLEATNPCGEVPLLPYEPCCLGSINLHAVVKNKRIDFEFLEYLVRTSIRFLDNVQELSYTTVSQINETSKNLRRLGLGVMGWADLLAELEVSYDSEEAFELAEYLSWFISFFAWSESMNLAEERGVFPLFDKNKVDQKVFTKTLNSYAKFDVSNLDSEIFDFRNVSVTSIAPTGTIAIVAGVNSSIEPFYGLAYKRNITEGADNKTVDSYIEINPILFKKLKELAIPEKVIEEIKEHVLREGTIQNCPLVPDRLKPVFKTAHEIHWKDHVKAQASWQSYISNAVSKTINMPNSSTVEDIENAYLFMWESGLKGGTVYRDGSKSYQILNSVS